MKIYKRIASFAFAILFLFSFAMNDVQAAQEYTLNNKVNIYTNAVDASNGTNPSGTYSAGDYFIYKEYNGMYNISTIPASPGGWMNPQDNSTTTNTIDTTTTDRTTIWSQPTKVYQTTASAVNVRTGAGTSYRSLGLIYSGSIFEGTLQSNGWIKFVFNGQTAYTSADYHREYTTTTTRYTTGTVNIRDKASLSSSNVVGSYAKGQAVQGIKLGDWFRITYNGKVAYISYSLTTSTRPTTPTTTTTSTSKVYITTGNAVNVRTGPSTSYRSLGFNYNGSIFEGTKQSNGWIKFTYKGQTAYTSGDYYREYTTTTKRVVTAVLNVRNKPSSTGDSRVIGSFTKGTNITGIKLGDWFRINYNGQIGYVYYKYTSPSGDTQTVAPKPVVPTKEVRYASEYLNVRQTPSLTGTIVGLLDKGARIEGFKEDDWFKITFEGNTRYVSYEYTLSESEMPTPTLANTHKRTVTASVNVRSKASDTSEIYGSIAAGTQINGILDGSWVKFVYGKSIGYIYAGFSRADEPETRVEPTPSQGNETTIPSTGSREFILALDPGHGFGSGHNRGGVLFNEGDQNYYFSQTLTQEANKYKNVRVVNSRSTIYDDPSLSGRAAFGKGADLFLSLHTNAATGYGAESIRGVEVFSSHYSENIDLGNKITKMVASLLNTPNRGTKFLTYSGALYRSPLAGATDYWGVFRYDNNAKTKYLIEFVFHTNYQDSKAYLDNQQALARNLMELIANEYGLERK